MLRTLLLLVAVAALGCSSDSIPSLGNSSPTAENPLEFDEVSYFAAAPFVDSPFARPFVHEYSFVNKSQRPVKITKVVTGCSCAVVSYPRKQIAPNERGSIRLQVRLAGRRGQFDTDAVVIADGNERAATKLQIGAYVVRPPSVAPAILDFGQVRAGQQEKRSTTLKIPLGPAEELPEVTCSSDNSAFSCSVSSVELQEQGNAESKRRQAVATIHVSFRPDVAGRLQNDDLLVRVKDRVKPVRIELRASSVHPRFAVDPRELNFGQVPAEGASRIVRVRARAPDAQLSELTATWNGGSTPDATAEVRHVNNSEAEIEVRVGPEFSGVLDARLAISDGHGDIAYLLSCLGYSRTLNQQP
jgi:Protein of unknown function (DUF1573)